MFAQQRKKVNTEPRTYVVRVQTLEAEMNQETESLLVGEGELCTQDGLGGLVELLEHISFSNHYQHFDLPGSLVGADVRKSMVQGSEAKTMGHGFLFGWLNGACVRCVHVCL